MSSKKKSSHSLLNRRGSVFILAVWSLFILSVFALGVGKKARQDIILAGYFQNHARSRYLAEAAVLNAGAVLKQDANDYDALNESWSTGRASDKAETAFKEIKLGDGRYSFTRKFYNDFEKTDGAQDDKMTFGMVDEERKININTASEAVLESLLSRAPNVDRTAAHEIASSIIDWRDPDSSTREGGAEDQYYQFLKKPYDCKDGELQVLEELLLVKGVTEDVFESVKDFVTIYGDGRININTADTAVLSSVGIGNVLINKIAGYRQGRDKRVGTEDDNIFKKIDDVIPDLSRNAGLTKDDAAVLESLIAEKTFTVASAHYAVFIHTKMGKRSEWISSVIHKERGIQYWHES